MSESALAGLRVLELSTSVGGAYTGKLLADLGAEVLLVEPPEGHALRRLGPFPGPEPDPERSGLFLFLCANKDNVVLDLEGAADRERLLDLAAGADLVLETLPPGRLEALGLGYGALRARNPALVLTSLTGFGQYGPYRDWQGSELVHWALSGYLYFTGDPAREPLMVPDQQAPLHGGAHAALASLAALAWARRTGEGQWVDVSIFEAMLSAHIWTTLRWTHEGQVQTRTGSEMLPCADGWAHFMTGGFKPEFLLLAERPDLLDDPRFTDKQLYIDEGKAALTEILSEWTRRHPREEVFRAAQELQIAMAPAYDIAGHLASPILASRDWILSQDHPRAGRLRMPGFPYKLSETPAAVRKAAPDLTPRPPSLQGKGVPPSEVPELSRASGALGASDQGPPFPPREGGRGARSGPLAGLRIVEVTNNWAGPVSGRYLADLGAEVVKIESPKRLAARTGRYAGGQTFRYHWNRVSYANKLNRNKYGMALDLALPEGRAILLKLARMADVVIENNSPRVMRQLGVDYSVLREVNPSLIYVSISAFGQRGAARDYVAFGSNIEASCGLAAVTGYPDDPLPYTTNNYYADPIAGCQTPVAILAALAYRERTGKGQYVDVSLHEGGIGFFPETFLEYTLGGRETAPQGNRHRVYAPQGVYPSMGDDMWLALTVRDDADWRRLRGVVGDARLDAPRFATVAGRRAHHDELDVILAEWTRRYDHNEAARLLQAAGVPAAPALANWEMVSNLHAHARGFYVTVPQREMGAFPQAGLPWKLSATPGSIRFAGPDLGEHNRFVLEEMLGLSAVEVADLYARRVVAEEPPPEFLPPPPAQS
jgi:crotonobetainyl-CoA:carnitine CoA-transferase CaiB-like acyl-CoA transferase